jgi:hypothetical protein
MTNKILIQKFATKGKKSLKRFLVRLFQLNGCFEKDE